MSYVKVGRPLAQQLLIEGSYIGILWITLMLDIRCDAYLGPQWTFLLFYMILNVVVSEHVGGWFAYLFAILAALCRSFTGTLVWNGWEVEIWSALNCIIGFVLICYLIQRKNRAIIAEKRCSVTDPLTRIPNRRAFNEHLETALAHAKRHHEKVSLAFIDVDGFKPINDTQGHQRGDELLCLIARTLANGVRAEDIAARLGGDEFGIVFSGDEGLIHRIKSNLDDVCYRNGFKVSFSIGIVVYTGIGYISCDQIIRAADSVMYEVKQTSKNAIKVKTA